MSPTTFARVCKEARGKDETQSRLHVPKPGRKPPGERPPTCVYQAIFVSEQQLAASAEFESGPWPPYFVLVTAEVDLQ
eukprot:3590313-Amphidinium_carterae.2